MSPKQARLAVAALLLAALGACDGSNPLTDRPREITIADLTGMNPDAAVRLVDRLDLHIEVETITPTDGSELAGEVVLRQAPPAGTRVPAGSTLTLFVPEDRPLRQGEKSHRLLTHCGLSFPLRFEKQSWLPVERGLRRTINPPDGFSSDGYYDEGTIRRVDDDTVVYTSSMGIEIEYEPTTKKRGGCE